MSGDIFSKLDKWLGKDKKEEEVKEKKKFDSKEVWKKKNEYKDSVKQLCLFIRDWSMYFGKVTDEIEKNEFIDGIVNQYDVLFKIYAVEDNIKKAGFDLDELDKIVLEEWARAEAEYEEE